MIFLKFLVSKCLPRDFTWFIRIKGKSRADASFKKTALSFTTITGFSLMPLCICTVYASIKSHA